MMDRSDDFLVPPTPAIDQFVVALQRVAMNEVKTPLFQRELIEQDAFTI